MLSMANLSLEHPGINSATGSKSGSHMKGCVYCIAWCTHICKPEQAEQSEALFQHLGSLQHGLSECTADLCSTAAYAKRQAAATAFDGKCKLFVLIREHVKVYMQMHARPRLSATQQPFSQLVLIDHHTQFLWS